MLSEKQSWLGSGPVFSPIFAVFCMKGYRGQSFLSLVQPSLYTECTLSMRWITQMNKMASPNKRAHFYHSWRFMQRISFDSMYHNITKKSELLTSCRHRKELFILFICVASYFIGFSCITRVNMIIIISVIKIIMDIVSSLSPSPIPWK